VRIVSTPVNTLQGPLVVLREAEMRLLADIAAGLAELGEENDRQRLLDVIEDLRDLFSWWW
jgi:hypothetical protein